MNDDTRIFSGVSAILLALVIYAINFIATRFSVLNGLTSYDLVALRYLVAGPILLPYFCQLGFKNLGGIGWTKAIILTILAGSPYMLVFIGGLSLAPAAHGAILNPGVVPSVVFISMVLLGMQSFSILRMISLVFIIIGLLFVTGASFETRNETLVGDLMLFATGISWGLFTVLIRLWEVKPMQAACIVSVLSLVYLPLYGVMFYHGFEDVSLTHILTQAIFQGVIMSLGTLYLVAFAVRNIGAQSTSLFSPFVPLITAILAVPILGETLLLTQWMGIFIVVFGMLFASLTKKATP